METFTRPRAFIRDPGYVQRRNKALTDLAHAKIDPPLVNIIKDFNALPHCFTLQCCFGHFVVDGQEITLEAESLAKYPKDTLLEYRIAYLALCIENSDAGKRLYRDLSAIEQIGAGYIQFHGADWFWQRHANSYALQAVPERFKAKDTALVDFDEALVLEKTKARMFEEIQKVLVREKESARLKGPLEEQTP
ncbi:MAG: hypothetical protein SVS15_09085 [Thermodesulfobacteriota bacterium]|nr:hypothetical protein [Thermodesulfobacteriota bacterium]